MDFNLLLARTYYLGFTCRLARTLVMGYTILMARTRSVGFTNCLARTGFLVYTGLLANPQLYQPLYHVLNVVYQYIRTQPNIASIRFDDQQPVPHV